MHIDTGELKRFNTGEVIPEGFVELTEEEEKQAAKILNGKASMMLSKSNKLRKSVTKRYNDGMNRQQRRRAEKEARKRRK